MTVDHKQKEKIFIYVEANIELYICCYLPD